MYIHIQSAWYSCDVNLAHVLIMAHYGEDDGLPEPVYFKLENFQLPDYVLNSDPDQDLYSDDDSSVGDEDVELNLFAPPPES